MGNAKGVRRDFEGLEKRRLEAAKLFKEGESNAAVARKLKVSPESVRRWKAQWRQGGASKLKKAGRAGRKSRLDAVQLRKVEAALLRGAMAHGFTTELWTLPRVAEVVQRITGVKYHPRHVNRILWALGWSCQKPKMISRARDEKAIELWRTQTWKRIKKKPKNSAE